MKHLFLLTYVVLSCFTAEPANSQTRVDAPVPAQINVPRIEVRNVARDSREDRIFAAAREVLAEVVNDSRFRTRIVGGSGQQPMQFTASMFRHRDGTVESKNPAQIWNIIRCGIERPPTGLAAGDREIDLQVLLVPKRRPTVGSTVLGKFPIRTGYWFVNSAIASNDAVSLARHMMHEWLHVAGFFHYPSNSARGDVPYKVGELVREISKELRDEALAAERSSGDNFVEAKKWRDRAVLLTENELLASLLDDAEDELEISEEEWNTPLAEPDRASVDAACGPELGVSR
jgi:hypothetical protein